MRAGRRFAGLSFPAKIRAEISAVSAANLSGEALLDFG